MTVYTDDRIQMSGGCLLATSELSVMGTIACSVVLTIGIVHENSSYGGEHGLLVGGGDDGKRRGRWQQVTAVTGAVAVGATATAIATATAVAELELLLGRCVRMVNNEDRQGDCEEGLLSKESIALSTKLDLNHGEHIHGCN